MRRLIAWVRFRWQNRRKPGRYSDQDLDRDRMSHTPSEGRCDHPTDHVPHGGL